MRYCGGVLPSSETRKMAGFYVRKSPSEAGFLPSPLFQIALTTISPPIRYKYM